MIGIKIDRVRVRPEPLLIHLGLQMGLRMRHMAMDALIRNK